MTVTATAAKKRGKKFKDVPVAPDNARSLPNIARLLVAEFPWLPQAIDMANAGAAAEFVKKRLFGARVTISADLVADGKEHGLELIKSVLYARDLPVGEVVANWPYAEVAQAIVDATAGATNVDVDAPIAGEIDLREDEPEESPAALKAPRVTKAALAPPGRTLPKPIGQAVMLGLAAMERHPANRTPLPRDVEERAKSLQEDGQLEDVVVRALPGARYQIISGETRSLAAKSLGWSELRCTVIECDDAEALRLVALYNGQRTDLNPIQKAQLIETLHQAGLSREEAARCVGLESGSAASNLVRLLKLPQIWQDRVAAGELAESWARALLPIATIKDALDALDDAFRDRDKVNGWGRIFLSRATLEHAVAVNLTRFTRRLDDTKRSYRGEYFHALGRNSDAMGDYPCLLHKDEIAANRAKLKIVTLSIDGKDVEVATNCKLFDELQCAIIRKRHEEKAKKKATAAGKKADAGGKSDKPKTAAEIKQDAENRARQLQRSIEDWRERLMRSTLAAAIADTPAPKTPDPRLLKLALHFLCEAGTGRGTDPFEKLQELLGVKDWKKTRGADGAIDAYQILEGCDGGSYGRWHKITSELCAFLIAGDADDPWEIELWPETLQALFDEWGCDLTAAWRKLHAAKDPMLEEFFEMHRKEELRTLAKEVTPELHLAESLGKPQMLKLILGRTRPPELPKCLLPAKKRETGSGKRAAGKQGAK